MSRRFAIRAAFCLSLRGLLVAVAGVLLLAPVRAPADEGDTLVVRTFTFNDIETRRATFEFPDDGRSWQRILMRYTLKCDEATVGDPHPCGEWDSTQHPLIPSAVCAAP